MSVTINRSLLPSAALLFFLLAAVLYGRIVSFNLTYFDDNVWIKDYGWLIQDISRLKTVFLQTDLISKDYYRPLLNAAFILNAQIPSIKYGSFYIANIILHVINAIILMGLLTRWGYERPRAFFFSLIFLTHPALVSAVAWIPGRTDSLLALWILLSMGALTRYLQSGKRRFWAAHFLFWIFGLFTKETAIALPVAAWFYLRFIHAPQPADLKKYILPWIYFGSVFLLWRAVILGARDSFPVVAALRSLIENAPAFLIYFGKCLLPFQLSVLPITQDSTLLWGGAAAVLLAAGLYFSDQKRKRWIIFGAVWFIVFLAPSLVFSFIHHEYRLYLPLIGILMIVFELDALKSIRFGANMKTAVFVTLLGALGLLAYRHSGHYADRETFWETAVTQSPHAPIAQRNRGAMYFLDGDLAKAEMYFREALILNPKETMVHNNLGLISMNRGLYQDALKEFEKEIRINPTYDNAYYNMGLLFSRMGQIRQAEGAWWKAVSLNPNNRLAYQNLYQLYHSTGQSGKAQQMLRFLSSRGLNHDELVSGGAE